MIRYLIDTDIASFVLKNYNSDLVGLSFIEDGCCALATNNTIFRADLGIEGKKLA